MKKIVVLLLCLLGFVELKAQMPHDAIYMNKKLACGALIYGNSSWTQYWENGLKRDNPNIGRLTTQSATAMIAYGITRDINVIAMVPYVKTEASQGNLMGQQGFQDASFFVKTKSKAYHGITAHGVLGFSVPVTNYVPDFMPMSIGLGAKTLVVRGMLSYALPKHLYVNSSIAYQARSQVKADRDSYLAGSKLYQTNQVAVPDAFDAAFRLGYLKKDNQIELFAEHFSCTKGDDIRRNDMPFLTNDMTMTTVGMYVKYQPKSIGVNARVAYVVDGQNVGQSTTVSIGLLYLFKVK
ncbi:hypothetical protein SKC35_01440 [Aquirufa sp. KTFRIE-69F]|uniref:Transporter n=1 Tax=Aquirufa originis TaxID=3096514 RepID=A0ABW6D2V1_9BACT